MEDGGVGRRGTPGGEDRSFGERMWEGFQRGGAACVSDLREGETERGWGRGSLREGLSSLGPPAGFSLRAQEATAGFK